VEGQRQLSLFPAQERVGPAPLAPGVARLAASLPRRLRLGTSSWSFPGWAGLVYDRRFPVERLAREGLAAYARHPLLRTVGVDRTYYAPLARPALAEYAASVPDDFRFVVKAHEACTRASFASAPGAARAPNPRFLDAAYASEAVVGPFVEGLGAKAGVLLFQFPPQPAEGLDPESFADRLHRFLRALPRGLLYAVELRSAARLTARYAEALADAGAVHCLAVHPSLPDLATQARVAAAALQGPLVLRWMLRRDAAYEAARERYRPFDRLVDEDVATREAVAALCAGAAARGAEAYVIANNKAEGSSPLTLLRLAQAIAALRRAAPRRSR